MEATQFINNHIIPSIAKGATIGKNYTIDLIHRTMYCLVIQDIITIILLIVICIIIILFAVKKLKKIDKKNKDDRAFIIVMSTMSLIILSGFIYIVILDLVQDFIVPEITLYQFYKQK